MSHRAILTIAIGIFIALSLVLSGAAPIQQTASAKSARAAEDVLPLTCAQAWVKAEKKYDNMIAIVKTLARVSLANRELKFPDTRAAGQDAGKGIATDCKADPDSLLFAIVDKHVRRVVEASGE
jgi:hypothetical protein